MTDPQPHHLDDPYVMEIIGELELSKDVIVAQNEIIRRKRYRILELEEFIRGLEETPHEWLRDAIKEILE